MMLIILVAALGISLFVLQKYITGRIYSQTHRFLPLILGMICFTDFFQIVEYLTRETAVFAFLEKILLVQMLYFLIYYIMDVVRIRFPRRVEDVLFVGLLLTDIAMFLEYGRNGEIYQGVFYGTVTCYISIMLYLATKAYFFRNYSRKEHYVNLMMYLALTIPCSCLVLQSRVRAEWGELIVPVSLTLTNGIVYYLMKTGQLWDSMTLMKEKLYDTSDIAVVLFDEDCYYLDANHAARKLFPEQLGDSSEKKSRILCREQLKDLLDSPDEMIEFAAKGQEYYQCVLQPIINQNRHKGYILSIVNITKQKRETQLMEKLKEMAEEQTASKSRFLACMSHDLRSPLHAIIGVSDIMLSRKEMEGRNRSLMRYVKSAGNTLLELVDSILLFSKLESGKLEISNSPYDLDRILEELANMCVVNLQNRPVNFSITLKSEHPSQLVGDGMCVREMLQNLLANAVKYTEQGEIRCELTCKEQAGKCRIDCTVTDTGPGMNDEQIMHIFEEYASGKNDTVKEGTGLGLYIVKQLAVKLGGDAGAESIAGKGSVFRFHILQDIAHGASMEPPVTFNEDMLLRRQVQGMEGIQPNWIYPDARVLVADDMKVNQEIFKELLRPWKCSVDLVGNGQDAIDAVRANKYQMVFLDRMMPDMTGMEAAAQIQKIRSVPLVLVTANLEEETNDYYQKYGFHALLIKPVDTTLLQNVVESLIPDRFKRHPEAADPVQILEDIGYEGNRRGYRRMLEAFVQEAQPLVETIAQYAGGDYTMFQTKVHGIKGASIQIGENALSESAEVMEMAAKTENYSYIDRHMDGFIEELRNAVQEVSNELARMTIQTGMVTPAQEQRSVEDVFVQLRNGMDTYDMKQIEDALRILHGMELSTAQRDLLDKVQEAYNDLEYETGAALLADFERIKD